MQYWHGVDVNVNVRMRNGLTLQGGTSTGRAGHRRVRGESSTTRAGGTAASIEPFRTQVNGLASYTIPKVDVQVSGTFQSRPGGSLAANWVVPSAVVAQTLGRPLVGRRRQRDDQRARSLADGRTTA